MADAHALLARAFLNLDCYDEALKHARQAIALNPHWADAHAALASAGRHGPLRGSAPCPSAGNRTGSGSAAPLLPLGLYHALDRGRSAPHRTSGAGECASGSRSLVDRVHSKFASSPRPMPIVAMSSVFFATRSKAAHWKRQMIGHKAPPTLRAIDALCRELNAEWMRRHQGVGDASPLPVFIVGMPRSGSTLVEQILASHPSKFMALWVSVRSSTRLCQSLRIPCPARSPCAGGGAVVGRRNYAGLALWSTRGSAQRDAPARVRLPHQRQDAF